VHWKTHFVDRRVKAAIAEMIESAHAGLIRLVRKKVPSVPAKAIAGSLARLAVTIESPAMPIAPTRPRRPALVSPGTVRGASARRSSAEALKAGDTAGRSDPQRGRKHVRVTLSQLIAAGLLKAPLTLFRNYKGRRLEATLRSDGSVQFGGKTYDSCSTAADQARRTVTGRQMNTNGWSFWQYDDDGSERQLNDARQEFLGTERQSPTLRLKGSGFRARPLSG
jgi:hypothetical protein